MSAADASELEFDATVVGLSRSGVVLDDTRFDPSNPRRDSDVGTLNKVLVRHAELLFDGTVLHRPDEPSDVERFHLGQRVNGAVDSRNRVTMMHLDTAAHLAYFGFLTAVAPAKREHRHVSATRSLVQISDVGRTPATTAEIAAALTSWITAVIADDLPIVTTMNHRRCWHIDGIGTTTCSGSHPLRTGELSLVDVAAEAVGPALLDLTVELSG